MQLIELEFVRLLDFKLEVLILINLHLVRIFLQIRVIVRCVFLIVVIDGPVPIVLHDSCDILSNGRELKNVLRVGPLQRILIQHAIDQLVHPDRVVCGQVLVIRLDNALDERDLSIAADWLEGIIEAAQVIQKYAQRPNVSAQIVTEIVLPHLWAHVVRCADLRLSQPLLAFLGGAEVG
jgi:hypothetical protein